jgi:hypothetical protein
LVVQKRHTNAKTMNMKMPMGGIQNSMIGETKRKKRKVRIFNILGDYYLLLLVVATTPLATSA